MFWVRWMSTHFIKLDLQCDESKDKHDIAEDNAKDMLAH